MDVGRRAKQFAPFAALRGLDETIRQQEIIYESKRDLSEEKKNELELTAQSAVLMEASTGKIIYEKQKEEERPPASVTKVMTMLLILDAVEDGKIKLEDEVTVSEYAASMGGSQVFLEPGEVQT